MSRRGGARPNSGPKPNPNSLRQQRLAARRQRQQLATVLQHPSVPFSPVVPPTTNEPSEIEEFDAPNDLSQEERQVWLQQAPHAFKNRTLTRASAVSFERYCKVVVLERNEAKSSGMGGANHRGLLKIINGYELQFLLTPAGKPMPEVASGPPKPAVNDDDAFFGGAGVGGR